ncbi:hypothetical protein Tco_1009108 [Tanacetum coccineum]
MEELSQTLDPLGPLTLVQLIDRSAYKSGMEVGWIRRIQRIKSSVYGILVFILLWSFGECRHGYAVSSLMDMAYWSSE